jgi:D-xylose transport system permease protein
MSTTSTAPEAAAPISGDAMLLKLRGISKTFGPVKALTRVDLDIAPGQATALVGDNGAGKSVTIKTISGLWAPDGGEMLWAGRPVQLEGPRDAEALGITTIYQDLALCDNLDIVQNMFLGHEPLRRRFLDEDAMEQAVRSTLRELSVKTIRSIRQPVGSLSGGQRQSVAVARALMGDAKLVVLDEPTAALGVAQTRMVLDLVRTLADRGVAVLMVSHNLNDVFSVADRITVLNLGRTVASGPASDFDTQIVVDYMTTGRSDRSVTTPEAAAASGNGLGPHARAVQPQSGPAPAEVEEHDEVASEQGAVRAGAPAELVVGPLSEWMRTWWQRARSGETGALPIVLGLVLIVIFFRIEQSQFLSSGNLVNLFVQAMSYVLLGAAEIFVLVLSEIDLSVGYVSAVGGFVIAELIASPVGLPWWLAVPGGLAITAAIGLLQGTIVTRLRVPSFVVTLGGLLVFNGVMIALANVDKTAVGGVINVSSSSAVYKLVNSNLSVAAGWIALAAAVGLYAAAALTRAARRRAKGLSAPPLGITLAQIGLTAVAGVVLVYFCTRNRGLLIPLKGVPAVIPIVGLVMVGYSLLLARTRLGRYMYAIGANPEAARRAGINVARIRTIAFMLAGLTAGMAGLVYLSRLGSIATDYDGGSVVLFGVASAVIGGASLFGGRGKPLHAVLGGFVIATVFNGLYLMGISAAGVDIATGIVLLLAATVDATLRRRARA